MHQASDPMAIYGKKNPLDSHTYESEPTDKVAYFCDLKFTQNQDFVIE